LVQEAIPCKYKSLLDDIARIKSGKESVSSKENISWKQTLASFQTVGVGSNSRVTTKNGGGEITTSKQRVFPEKM